MLEMPFTVVFIVSSSVKSIPNAVRAQGPDQTPNSPYSRMEEVDAGGERERRILHHSVRGVQG